MSRFPVVLLAVLVAVVSAPAARASQLITWSTTSPCIDPRLTPANPAPSGAPPRPAGLGVNVLLPDGYDASRPYPVLYLLHGSGGAFDYWMAPTKGGLAHVAAGFPGIVVMPEAQQSFYTDWFDGGKRGTDGRCWETYHLRELIPMVEQRLRVLPGRSNHAIAGLSMGGYGALYYAEQLPGYFGTVAAFSPLVAITQPEWGPLFQASEAKDPVAVWGDRQADEFSWQGHDPTFLAANLAHTRVMVRIGDGVPATTEFDPDRSDPQSVGFDAATETYLRTLTPAFADAARAAGADVTYVEQGGIHQWPLWRADLAAAITWGLFRPVVEQPDTWTYRTTSPHGRAWDVRYALSPAPEQVITFERRGAGLKISGTGSVAIIPACGMPFEAMLPLTRAWPPRCALALTVTPRRIRAGRRVRVRVRVSAVLDGTRRAIGGARVRIAGRTARTDARGRATLVVRLPRRGRVRLTATRDGFAAARATLRAS